jgi:hypothetical protein
MPVDLKTKVSFPKHFFCGAQLREKIGEVIIKNTCFQYKHSVAIFIALTESDSNCPDKAARNYMAILFGMKKMSEIELCRKLWKYRSKKIAGVNRASPLPQIALHRY